jgi:hypothetical protein
MFISHGTSDKGVFMDNPELLTQAPVILAAVDIAAVKLRIEGAFDAKIKEYTAIRDELASKQSISVSLAEAKKTKADADARALEVTAKNDANKQRESDLAKREIKIAETESSLVAKANLISISENELSVSQAKAKTRLLEDTQNLINRDLALSQKELQLKKDQDLLAQQKAEFNAKLTALKA